MNRSFYLSLNPRIMSYYKDDQSSGSHSSSSPPGGRHYQYSNYPPPNQHHFYPPLPPLPPPASHSLHGMYEHGYHTHHYNGSPGAPSFVNGYAHHHHQPAVRNNNEPSLGGSFGQGVVQRLVHHPALRGDDDRSAAGKTHLGSDEASPSPTKESSHLTTSPYFSRPPPLPPATGALTVSPNDHPREDSNSARIYRNSPYFSEAPNLDTGSGSSESSTSSISRPVPAKSAFMCFSSVKGKEISDKNGADGSKGGFVEAVAAEWRSLSKQEKSYWEDMAKNEKTRFAKEKQAYKGPLARKLRAKKNPLAPKRPMSAFLMYAQQKRRPLQQENPDMPNADISRLLGEIWRNTNMAEKRPFLEREEVERKIYKAKMEAWKNDEKLAKSMKSRVVAVARKKLDKHQVAASITREISHSSERYDPTQNYQPPYPSHAPAPTRQHTGLYAEDQAGSPPSYHEYNYDASNWTATHNQQEPGHHVKYSYPRPCEDHYKGV